MAERRTTSSRLLAELDELDRFGRGAGGGFTRLAWSLDLRAAVDWAEQLMRDAGLGTTVDAAGNLIGRWEAGTGKAVLVGSHLDTVTAGGRFDGALGVLSALEAVRRLREQGIEPARPIWVVAFMDEEGERFGSVMLGSRAFVGDEIPPEEAERRDDDGVTLAQAMRGWGREFGELAGARAVDQVHAYLELHCELGPVLEAEGVDIGAVTEIVGLIGLSVTLSGTTNHAGTTPMQGRRDAVVGAASVISALRDRALQSGEFTATVGGIGARPGGVAAIAGECTFLVDLRAPHAAGLSAARKLLDELLSAACSTEGLSSSITEMYALEPTPMDPAIVSTTCAAAELAGLSVKRMSSGAGHDAMLLGPHVPAGMIFVPSVAGVGHAPEELTKERDIENGAAVLTEVVRRLSQ
jgi:hydantoinase/carbamoylase family amidase